MSRRRRFEETKEWGQFLHTQKNGAKRYSVKVGFEEQNHIIRRIQHTGSRRSGSYFLFRQSNSTSHWLVLLHEIWVLAVYDKNRQSLRTLLPLANLLFDPRYSLEKVPEDILEDIRGSLMEEEMSASAVKFQKPADAWATPEEPAD